MRLRRKKNLDSRIEKCSLISVIKSTSIYRLKKEDRYDFVNFKELFQNDNPIEVEIGCGKGGFITELAKRNPDVNYVGVEMNNNVIVSASENAQRSNLKNVTFFNCGAEILEYLIPKNTADRIYLNFSCPYPKKQYENHRLTYPYFLEIYKIILKSHGEIVLKTDSDGLFEYSLSTLSQNGFKITFNEFDLYSTDTSDNIATEYEKKFVALGKKIHKLKAVL